MTELELVWKEYTDALDACCKYAELASMNCELCHEACLDAVHYSEQVSKCMQEIREGFEEIFYEEKV